MARIRSVKPELRRDLTVAEWPRDCRYAWVLLWGYLDDHGRGLDDLRLLVSDLFPLDRDITERRLDGWLNRMTADSIHGTAPLCRYEVDGRRFLHAPKWRKSQRVSHPQDSQIPPCPRHDSGPIPESFANGARTEPEPFATSRTPEDLGSKGTREVAEESANAEEPIRSDVEGLCRYFLAAIERNGSKGSVTKAWRTEARLLLDKDERDPAEVRAVIDWSTRDSFWRANVLSVPTLRAKYDQLRLGMQRERPMATDDPSKAYLREPG